MDTNTKKGYDLINRRRKQWVNEEEVRHAWMKGLEEALQIDLDAERAKRDSSYNNVVIEFKGPGLFKGSETSPKFIEATDGRLLKYIPRLAAEQGLDEPAGSGTLAVAEHALVVGEGLDLHLLGRTNAPEVLEPRMPIAVLGQRCSVSQERYRGVRRDLHAPSSQRLEHQAPNVAAGTMRQQRQG